MATLNPSPDNVPALVKHVTMRKEYPPDELIARYARVGVTVSANLLSPHVFTPCYLWAGTLFTSGYGSFWDGVRPCLAHRVAWELACRIEHRMLPNKICICHKCDVKSCVRFDHLFAGTRAQNNADCKAKLRTARGANHGLRLHPNRRARGLSNGQHTHPECRITGEDHWTHQKPEYLCKGEASHFSKLTDTAIRQIRLLYSKGETLQELGKQVGVSKQAISYIVNRKTWKHVR